MSTADALEALGVDEKTARAIDRSEETSGLCGRAVGQRYHDTAVRNTVLSVVETLLAKLYRRRAWPHMLESLAKMLLERAANHASKDPLPAPGDWRRVFDERQDRVAGAIIDLVNESPRDSVQRRTALSIVSVLGVDAMSAMCGTDREAFESAHSELDDLTHARESLVVERPCADADDADEDAGADAGAGVTAAVARTVPDTSDGAAAAAGTVHLQP